jgi:hypothetical protein
MEIGGTIVAGTVVPLAVWPFIVEALVKLLAVAGGAAIGAGAIGMVARRLTRTVTRRDVPRRPMQALRLLGGVASGWGVWLMVFSPGGSGLFGGGGSLFGEQGSAQTGTRPGAVAVDTATKIDPASKTEPPVSAPRGPIRVTLLGGPRVVGERFYVLEGDPQPHTLVEIQKILSQHEQESGDHVLELMIYQNSVARNHAAVGALTRWAEAHGFAVRMPTTNGEIP